MIELTREFLWHKYVEEKKTISEVASEVGWSKSGLRKKLLNFGIPIRTKSDATILRLDNGVLLDDEKLKLLYADRKSPQVIAITLGTTRQRVLGRLKKLGVFEENRTYKGPAHWNHCTKLSPEHVSKILESRKRNGSHTGPIARHVHDRFWDHVVKTAECWNWDNGVAGVEYGRIYDGRKSEKVLAHRISWEIHFGGIPEGSLVLHKCDNPACVNPDHLFLGNHKDDTEDMLSKGRSKGGPDGTPPNVVKFIRTTFAKGSYSATELAQLFGITKMTVYNIVRGVTRSSVE